MHEKYILQNKFSYVICLHGSDWIIIMEVLLYINKIIKIKLFHQYIQHIQFFKKVSMSS